MIQGLYKVLAIIVLINLGLLLNNIVFAASNTEGIQVYQKNLHLLPERKQKLTDDIDRYRNSTDDLWDVLRQEFVLPHYEDNPIIQEQIQWYMNHQDFLQRAAMRAEPYLYYILQQIHKRHLPAELVLLPIIESEYNPFAYSSRGAAGIWQMMPSTASGFGIKQNWWYDGRRDVIASTKAALNFLAYLGNFFGGNWLLATAAYNTGEGNVISAMRRNVRDGLPTDFWSLPLAQQTQQYVPRLLALAVIISRPDEYPLNFPMVRNAPYLAEVDVGTHIDLKSAAYLAGLSLKQLKQFNSGYNRSAIGPNGPYKIVLPIEHVEQFTQNLSGSTLPTLPITEEHEKKKSSDAFLTIAKKFKTAPVTQLESSEEVSDSVPVGPDNSPGNYTLQPGDTLYMVRKGDDIEKIAKRFHITANTLQVVNRISGNKLLETGQPLIIPTHANIQEKNYQLSPGDTIYMVRKGDDILKIAKKFHTTASDIRVTNLLASNEVQEGDRLVIPARLSG